MKFSDQLKYWTLNSYVQLIMFYFLKNIKKKKKEIYIHQT